MRTFARCLSTVLVLLALCALPQPAGADATIWVGDSTPASCTEAALQRAVEYARRNPGRLIKFNCGREPVSILLIEEPLTFPDNTTIDGDGLITLIAAAFVPGVRLLVDHATTVVLRELTLINAHLSRIVNQGTLTIDRSNVSSIYGILNEGTLTVMNSSIFDSGHDFGIGIDNEGTLTVKNSVFTSNTGFYGGGIAAYGGFLTVKDSAFSGNTAFGYGGGIYLQTGTVAVYNSKITQNTATVDGGGIYRCCGGTLRLEKTSVTGNTPNDIAR